MDYYLGEIRQFAFYFAPRGWALCNGQLMPIQRYSALFALLGTYYGGDGKTTFGLPNLQGGVPLGMDPNANWPIGTQAGSDSVTLIQGEMPTHNHAVIGLNNAGLSVTHRLHGIFCDKTFCASAAYPTPDIFSGLIKDCL